MYFLFRAEPLNVILRSRRRNDRDDRWKIEDLERRYSTATPPPPSLPTIPTLPPLPTFSGSIDYRERPPERDYTISKHLRHFNA